MKNNKSIFGFICLILFSCSSESNTPKEIIIDKFITEFNLSLKKAIPNELAPPRGCFYKDSLLFIFEPVLKDHFLKCYSLKTGMLKTTFGIVGKGPNEFLNPRIKSQQIDSFLCIGDSKYFSFLSIKDLVLKNNSKVQNRTAIAPELYPYNFLFRVSDSLIITNSPKSYQLSFWNPLTDEISNKNYFSKNEIKINNNFILNNQVYDSYYYY